MVFEAGSNMETVLGSAREVVPGCVVMQRPVVDDM